MDRQEMQTIIVFYSIGGKEMAKVDANILPLYYQYILPKYTTNLTHKQKNVLKNIK